MSFMSLSLFLQQCPACLVCLTWMILEMRGKWLYSCCFVKCCFQDLFNIACSILVQFPSSFFSVCFVSIYVVYPYSSIDTTAAWKKSRFILSDRSDFLMIDNLLIAVNSSAGCILSLSVDEILLLRYVNLSTDFRRPPFRVEMLSSQLKHVLHFVCIHMEVNASCCLLQVM